MTFGWRCPTFATLIPPIRSIHSFPFMSYNSAPSALTISKAKGDIEVCATCLKKISRWVITEIISAKNAKDHKGAKNFSNLQVLRNWNRVLKAEDCLRRLLAQATTAVAVSDTTGAQCGY